jgi:hypothetical protein
MDGAIAQQASRQRRNVSCQQLLALGLDDASIRQRSWLFRVHRGVYSVGGPPRTGLEHATAALMACGDGAALSHSSAMALWGSGDVGSCPSTSPFPEIADHLELGCTDSTV